MALTIQEIQDNITNKNDAREIINQIADYIQANQNGVSIPATSYNTNADAVADLGIGAIYKSTTLINGSPIILLTV